MNQYSTKAREILEQNFYCTVATASKDGVPWVSPVFFAYDEQYRIYWVSNKDAKHSLLIRENPRVALVVFNSTAPEGEGDGVYIEAAATELKAAEDVQLAMDVLGRRVSKDEFRVKDKDQVTGNGVWRIYRATPKKTWKLSRGKLIRGQYVDERVEVQLTR
ncbi:MAG: pyridoxamine 5'-phosphate oxidase family protein [bacterium]|nr:pyridoxamine 5'-phosphate oxidase family protein [bacterium]